MNHTALLGIAKATRSSDEIAHACESRVSGAEQTLSVGYPLLDPKRGTENPATTRHIASSEDWAMPRHLHEITAAMNAYAWTKHGPVRGPDHAPSYCAIGALLRHAGVPHDCILAATVASLSGEYDPLLKAKYGISGADAVLRIITANGEAWSRADATWRVLGLVSGTRESDNAVPRTGPTRGGPQLPPAA